MASTDSPTPVSNWTPDRLPDLTGKRYLITGANSGIGLEAAKILRGAGGDIVVASRSESKAAAAAADLETIGAAGSVDQVILDLADSASIRAAADSLANQFDGLDAVVNNAGVMQTPEGKTADGFETQFGTNHLGHFLFNGLVYDQVKARAGRIVPVSSLVHKQGKGIDFDDPMATSGYSPTKAYVQSKLANLMYGLELQRRLSAADSPVTSISAHPGYSATNLQSTGPSGFLKSLYKVTNAVMAQSAEKGAYSEALAAAGSEAVPGAYYGPAGLGEMRGRVGDATISGPAQDPEQARRLWDLSEELTGFTWEF